MSNGWDDMKKAKEDSYFAKKEAEALARLAKKREEAVSPRISPVSGEPMEQVVMNGVVVDRCPVSGGVWLDAGELEQLIELARTEGANPQSSWFSRFLKDAAGGKK